MKNNNKYGLRKGSACISGILLGSMLTGPLTASSISLENADFELPGTSKQWNWSSVPGWNTDTQATDSGVENGVETSVGDWSGYLKSGDPRVWNQTNYIIAGDEWIRVQVNARSSDNAVLEMSLYYDDNGTRQILKTLQTSTIADMGQYSLLVKASEFSAAAGKVLGVEFYNAGSGDTWMTIDNVKLEHLAAVQSKIEAGFGDLNVRYWNDQYPMRPVSAWNGSAWRGERVSMQLLLYTHQDVNDLIVTATNLSDGQGGVIDTSNVKIQYVRFMSSGNGTLSPDAETSPTIQVGDMLEVASGTEDISAATCQPVWVTIDVPEGASPGAYQGNITVSGSDFASVDLDVNLDVVDMALPPVAEWGFHLDLWQNPWAIARVENVTPWSQAHIDKLTEFLVPLADAGQKVITTTLVDSPWGGQTYDPYGTMIEWTKHSNGSWSFDYTIFDQYVNLCDSVGISKQISCFSMVAWGNQYQYFDEASGTYQTLTANAGTQAYNDHWSTFLQGFRQHLISKGWIDRTVISMDERSEGELSAAISLIKNNIPEVKISLAGKYFSALDPDIDDWCPWVSDVPGYQSPINQRFGQNNITTFYTMTWEPDRDGCTVNNFAYTAPVEQVWDGWYAAAKNLNGFLRWAANSWGADPLNNARNSLYQPGDAYQVYPGGRSSIRISRLREGIQDYEKIQILYNVLDATGRATLDNVLSSINYPQMEINSSINNAKAVLRTLSEQVAGGGGLTIEEVAVDNASFELPATTKQINWENVPGWSSDTVAVDSGVEQNQSPTDGQWSAFLWANDPAVWQTTQQVAAAGDTFELSVAAKDNGGASTFALRLYYLDGGSRVIVAQDSVALTSTSSVAVISFNADDYPLSIGKPVGIEFENGATGWLGFDNVLLTRSYAGDGGGSGNNLPPVAVDDSGHTTRNTVLVLNLLSNDSDPEGDALSITEVTQPAKGTVVINPGGQDVTFTPKKGFTGNVNFQYTVTDSHGGSSSAQVDVSVSR